MVARVGIPLCVECGTASNPCRCKVVGPTLGFLAFAAAAVVECPIGAFVYYFRHAKGRRIMAHPSTVIYPAVAITFLCASHKTKKSNPPKHTKEDTNQSTGKKFTQSLSGNFSGKARLMVKMISWKRVHETEEERFDDTDDEAVWRRTIMMGERCRPLDFSGKIEYDSHGNLVSQSP
ncbi:hypothetical protein RJ641_023166 [Dillenia turbinata]|uniref:Uncharacterized protein n=1 Tax=Dillenia turbinata TaxID=194707 RepID=A0AAN8UDS2_9MAGN